ncbi:MAG: urate hydroxylase PuuD, partial [Pseudomonas sp.]|nr:urate hydroxylase PuuD [Pseudomonas sp.]
MEAHLTEWLNLSVRWIHMIVGIAWIGASFYFNWLENNLERSNPREG